MRSKRMEISLEHAHHVIPNQSGDRKNPAHAWLASPENCVILCATCHGVVHAGGNYRTGAIAPPTYYPFSHGTNAAAHRTRAALLGERALTIWR